MDPRVTPTAAAAAEAAAEPLDNRPEVHNPGIDEQVAETGACGQVHLPTGRTCTREHRHEGSCDFVPRDQVPDSVAEHRAADGW
jgi:hypothetical protein